VKKLRWTAPPVLAAFAAGAALAGTAAAVVARNFQSGVYYSTDAEEESLAFEDFAGPARFTQFRVPAFVPPEYGKLIAVEGKNPAVFWFEDERGNLRNVPVQDNKLLVILRTGSRTAR
jgi:hypothetical protein